MVRVSSTRSPSMVRVSPKSGSGPFRIDCNAAAACAADWDRVSTVRDRVVLLGIGLLCIRLDAATVRRNGAKDFSIIGADYGLLGC